MGDWEKLSVVRESVLKTLEEARQGGRIGNSLEARVRLRAGGETAELLRHHETDLRYVFIVSQVDLETDLEGDGLKVEVSKADGGKCERCWNYSTEVGRDLVFATLCERCVPVVKQIV